MDSKSDSLKSNEEIIEELTKDLESSCIMADEDSTPKDSCKNDAKSNNVSGTTCESTETSEETERTEHPRDTSPPTDYIDEEQLAIREQSLSEADKEKLKNDAETLKNEGNTLFKNEEYVKAISVYTEGLRTCPLAYTTERSILYANRAAAKAKCLEDKESAISDCTKAIELNSSYMKVYIRRARLYEETDKLNEALEDFKKVLTLDPTHSDANYAVLRLPPLIQERNEKLKAEMLGKLKDLGNIVLKSFGLSTNNFELQKDPNSGGYSVKFNQNPN